MSRRTYGQYCGLAHALDLIGARWTMLILRELMTGPKRYKDLQKHLPGIGTNLLAARLKFLERQGLITKRLLPPPASTEAYDLTPHGEALEPALIELARWGLASIGQPDEDDAYGPHWSTLAMKAIFRPERAEGLRAVFEYRVGDDVFHAQVDDGTLHTAQGPATTPDVVLTTDPETYLAVVSGQTTMEAAIAAGRMTVEGNTELLERSGEFFDLSVMDAG